MVNNINVLWITQFKKKTKNNENVLQYIYRDIEEIKWKYCRVFRSIEKPPAIADVNVINEYLDSLCQMPREIFYTSIPRGKLSLLYWDYNRILLTSPLLISMIPRSNILSLDCNIIFNLFNREIRSFTSRKVNE